MSATTEYSSDAGNQESPTAASVALPNVFVTPPEEELNVPPWCCFDAVKDAQPGALAYEDQLNAELDYSAHAGDDAFDEDGEEIAPIAVADREEREDVFVMHSLVAEAENLREKLRSLELSVRNRPTTTLPTDEENISGPEAVSASSSPPVEPEPPKVSRNKSFFSFKSIRRKKSRKDIDSSAESGSVYNTETARASAENDHNFEIVQRPGSPGTDLELLASQNASRKLGFFSRRFKLSTKKTLGDGIGLGLKAKHSMDIHRSCETLVSPRLSQDPGHTVKRRFSFFDVPRSRFSTSSQSTIPTVPSIVLNANTSSSSLATSSVPPTPGGDGSEFTSLPSTLIEGSGKDLLPEHPPSSLMSVMDVSVENLAASLSLPSSYSAATDVSFSLDPLHFESLQFNSDDFP
ncbi:hypothetical protein M0805_003869 [Coniferiporia weirii]|nr:hypothetical protein M0805_003869 [Coniferiporia weirii]